MANLIHFVMVKNRERLLELKVYRRRRKNIRKRKQSREHYSFCSNKS